jgi:hypothetical protein
VFSNLIKKKSKKAAPMGLSSTALLLAACGSSSDDTSVSSGSTLLSITKSGDNYNASSVTGFSLIDQTTAKLDVADATSNGYSIKLDATGTGRIEFDFADAGDTVTLEAGSKVSGFTTFKVTDGTIDATGADLSSITRVEVASGLKITLAQIKAIPTVVSNSATGTIEVEVATEAEASELVTLLTDGTITVYGDANPIDLVAAPAATITESVLTSKETETAATVKPAAETPVDTSVADTTITTPTTPTVPTTPTTPVVDTAVADDVIRFTVSGDASGNYTVGNSNGTVTVTESGTDYLMTPASGTATTNIKSDVTSFVVNAVTMTGTAAVLDGETITGTGRVSITALEGDAAADLSNITVTGTKTAAVDGDVTFTGNLGTSFTTTVASGKTLTADVAKVTGQTIDGSGTTAVTDLNTSLAADLSGITSTTHTAAFNANGTFTGNLGTANVTVGSGITFTSAASVVAGKTMSGGTVSITGNVAANTDLSNITSTVDFVAAAPTVAVSTTLTLTAEQAATESFANSGTVVISASTGAQSTTVTGGVVNAAMGAGTDTLILGAAANVTAADEIDMGGDADEVRITADANGTGAVFDDAGAGWETLTMVASTTKDAIVALNLSTTDTTARAINAGAMTNTSAGFTLAIGTASKTTGALTITSSAGNNVIAGGAGDDILDFGTTSVTANDTIALGAGADEVKITAIGGNATTPTDQVFDDDALGWETLTIIENTATAAMDSRVSLDLSGSANSTARTINAAALTTSGALFTLEVGTATKVTGILTVTGGSNGDTITTAAGADVITAGDGADTLDGGAGNDKFIITALSDLTDGSNAVEDTIDGGANTDTIAFNGGVTLAAADDFTSKVSNVESLSANGAQASAISISTHSAFVGDTSIAIIDLSTDTNALGANIIDISAQTTSTAMSLRGSAGQDAITLDSGSVDTINVIGDIGSAITFAAADVITGFVSGTDKIKLFAGDGNGSGSNDNYVEVANADYSTFSAVLVAGNGALATLAGGSSASALVAIVADATDADAGEVALGAHVFVDTDGDGDADEVFILAGLASGSIAPTDFIA